MEKFVHETDEDRYMLQEYNHSLETTENAFLPVTPRPRALKLSNIPSELRLYRSSSPSSDRSVHQAAALSILNRTNRKPDRRLPREYSGQWLGKTARCSWLAARRQGWIDSQKSSSFSSSGWQYGIGNREEGYIIGDYLTLIRDDAQPGKEKRKRDIWKCVSCF